MKKWPLQDVYFWDKAPFFRLLVPLVAGIITYSYLSAIHLSLIIIIALITFALAAITAFMHKQEGLVKAVYFISLYIAIGSIGWLFSYHYDIRNNNEWFANNHSDGYVARIINEPGEKDKTWKLEVDVINTNIKSVTGKAFVYVYKNNLPLLFHEGDTLLLPDKWLQIKTAGNPYEFDYARYCSLNNIYYQQFLASDEIVLAGQARPVDLPLIRRAHKWCMQQLAIYITDKSTLGLMQAMLIGDEANLDPDLRQAYSATGIIHIIAISGSHIAFIFLIISFLLGWIKHNRWKWLKYLTAIPLIWVYVVMSGAPPSAVRAALMFSVFAFGLAFEKQPNSLNQLLATVFMLLLVNPNWLYAIGFQLSFLAVLSLVLFYKPIYKFFKPTNSIAKGIWTAIAASIAAEILTAPLAVYYFHLFPLLFIVANVLAYLFMGIVLIAGMCLVAVSPFGVLAKMLATVITALVQWFNYLVYIMQDMNPAGFNYLNINTIELLLLFAAILAIAVYLLKQQKTALFAGLTTACVMLGLLCYDEWTAMHQTMLIVYNISKANHIELIKGGYYSVLYTDTSINDKNRNYVLKPAHIGYRATHTSSHKGNKELLYVNGKTVLILNQSIPFLNKVQVDYVILNHKPTEVNPLAIRQIYNPKQIILGNTVSRLEAAEWIEACKRQNISLFWVGEKGAFVL